MNKSPKEILNALVTSYYYGRDTADLLETVQEVEKRINKDHSVIWTDEANIIVGTLILLYGNYGTSPRGGWFEDKEAEKEIKEALKQGIEELKQTVENEININPDDATDDYNPEKLEQLEKLGFKIPPREEVKK